MSRRAVAFLGMPQIARMLALPEGLRAVAVRDDFLRDGVAVLIEGDALDDQPNGVELPRLPVAMLDRTDLAMQAKVRHDWSPDGATIVVCCPVDPCTWTREWENVITTLAQTVDAVQQHLTMDHEVGL